jgi:hypothetical protein
MKPMRLTMFAVLAAVIFCGCNKSSSRAAESAVPYALAGQTIARLHWLGKKQLAAETNSAGLMRIWNEPESARLEAQTLDKLSTAPWRLFPHVATTNTAAAQWLRPLLEDCVQQESYLEIRCVTNHPGELAFAIQLPAGHAALWETNLAAVLESLTGLRAEPTQDGWSLKKHELPNLIELTRAGDWIVVGIGQDKNALLADFVARIQRNHSPVAATAMKDRIEMDPVTRRLRSGPGIPAPNFWLAAELDLSLVSSAFSLGWNLPDNLPKISLKTFGHDDSVYTRGELDFPKPLALTLEPWNLPTNIIHSRLGSFTAARGFAPWLASQKVWNDLQIGPPPNQFFGWASRDVPLATYFAAPVQDASNRVSRLTQSLVQKVSPWLATNHSGYLEASREFHGLRWSTIPFATPVLQSSGDFIFAGLLPNSDLRTKLPSAMLQELSSSNLVYYDWEITGLRMDYLFQVTQLFRLILNKQQLPSESASAAWLLANITNFGPCVTAVVQTGPEQLSFTRKSNAGFTAIELHLLADWLESPQFPRGLHSLQDERRSGRSRKPPAPTQAMPSPEKP